MVYHQSLIVSEVVDMLAGFLDLPCNDFVLLLEEAGLFDTIPSSQALRICFELLTTT